MNRIPFGGLRVRIHVFVHYVRVGDVGIKDPQDRDFIGRP